MPGPTHTARTLAALLSAWLLACSGSEVATPAAAPPPARRGLWVLAEGSQRVLEHPDRVPLLLETARAIGATDLFVQVYRGGRAWFETSLADTTPFEAGRAAAGEDPLARLLREAHAAGLRVHAWVNVLSLSTNRDAPLLRELGRSAVLVDQRGRSVLDYPNLEVPAPDGAYYRMGTPAVWLDPAAIGLAERLAATFRELLTRHPELDGLHFDYIRYPDVLPFAPGSRFGVGLDFGHGEATRALFREQTGLDAPGPKSAANADAWDHWRRDQLTSLVATLRAAARGVKPQLEVSAAVIPYADRAYLSLYQDWRRWLDEGLLEFAVPMAYTKDDRLLRYHAQAFAGSPFASRLWIGLGSWLFASEPARAVAQLRSAHAAGVANDAFFSYDAIAEAPALEQALREAAAGASPAGAPAAGP